MPSQYSDPNIATGVTNIAKILFGDPDARKEQQYMQSKEASDNEQARLNSAKAAEQEMKNKALLGWADALKGANPNINPNVANFLGTNIQGGFNPQQAADANRLMTALGLNPSENALRIANAGAGDMANINTAITTGQQSNVINQNEAAKERYGNVKQTPLKLDTQSNIMTSVFGNYPGATKISDDGKYVDPNPAVINSITPEARRQAEAIGLEVYRRTGGDEVLAANAVQEYIDRNFQFNEAKKSWFGDIGEPNVQAGFVPLPQQPTPQAPATQGWSIKRIQ